MPSSGRTEKRRFYFTVQFMGRNNSLNFSTANTSVMPFPMGPAPWEPFYFDILGAEQIRPCGNSSGLRPGEFTALTAPPHLRWGPIAGFYFTVQFMGRNNSLNFSTANTSVMPAM